MFPLSLVPASGAPGIDVTIDGAPVQEDVLGSASCWAYHPSEQSIRFTRDAMPGPGAGIVIAYADGLGHGQKVPGSKGWPAGSSLDQ